MTHRNRQGRRDPARARGAVAAGAPLVRIDLAGRCTIGPAAILPFVRQFAAVDREWFAAQDVARVQAWLGAFVGSALFEGVMVAREPWTSGAPT